MRARYHFATLSACGGVGNAASQRVHIAEDGYGSFASILSCVGRVRSRDNIGSTGGRCGRDASCETGASHHALGLTEYAEAPKLHSVVCEVRAVSVLAMKCKPA